MTPTLADVVAGSWNDPVIDNCWVGALVPIPTYPFEATTNPPEPDRPKPRVPTGVVATDFPLILILGAVPSGSMTMRGVCPTGSYSRRTLLPSMVICRLLPEA